MNECSICALLQVERYRNHLFALDIKSKTASTYVYLFVQTTHLASLMQNKGQLFALDNSAKKVVVQLFNVLRVDD